MASVIYFLNVLDKYIYIDAYRSYTYIYIFTYSFIDGTYTTDSFVVLAFGEQRT